MNSDSNQEGPSEERECPWKEDQDIVATIAKHIDTISDFSSFRATCRHFVGFANRCNFDGEDFPRLPYLLYSNERRRGNAYHRAYPGVPEGERRSHFLNLVTRTSIITTLPRPISIPYLSSSGWILAARTNSPRLNLVNFVWRIHTDLPSSDSLPRCRSESKVTKFVLSGCPESRDGGGFDERCLVFVIFGDRNQIAYCRLGETAWTLIESWDEEISDIIYDENKLYAVDTKRSLLVVDVNSPHPRKIVRLASCKEDLDPEKEGFDLHHYLIKITGKFHIISRFMDGVSTVSFRVFKLEPEDATYWEVDSLGDNNCAFVGLNTSVCAKCTMWRRVQLKENTIYFSNTADQLLAPDVGSYDLSNRSVDGVYREVLGYCPTPPTLIVPIPYV